jgi:uncharacterized membrane protein
MERPRHVSTLGRDWTVLLTIIASWVGCMMICGGKATVANAMMELFSYLRRDAVGELTEIWWMQHRARIGTILTEPAKS